LAARRQRGRSRRAGAEPEKLPTIGFFSAGSAAALVQRLHDLGGIECYNVVIEYRWGARR